MSEPEVLSAKIGNADLNVYIDSGVGETFDSFTVDVERLAHIAGAMGLEQVLERRFQRNPIVGKDLSIYYSSRVIRPEYVRAFTSAHMSYVMVANSVDVKRLPEKVMDAARTDPSQAVLNSYAQAQIEHTTRIMLAMKGSSYLDPAYLFADRGLRNMAYMDLIEQQDEKTLATGKFDDLRDLISQAKTPARGSFFQQLKKDVRRDVTRVGARLTGFEEYHEPTVEDLELELRSLVTAQRPLHIASERKAREFKKTGHFIDLQLRPQEFPQEKTSLLGTLSLMHELQNN